MSTTSTSRSTVTPRITGQPAHHPSIALAVLVACQLMVMLDATVVNVALPAIKADLGFTTATLSWVVTGYTLAFGGLLLLGGRLGDLFGRRRLLIAGVILFTIASLVGGLAPAAGWLLAARAAQGIGSAMAAPSTLALLAATFAEGPARNRALGIFSAAMGSAFAVGLILGGVLTEWTSWRWVMLVNIPIGLAVVLAAPRYLPESERHSPRLDVPGALTASGAMVSLVYGLSHAASAGWGDPYTLGALAAAAVLLAAFLTVETTTGQPLVPLRLLADRDRAGAYLNLMLLPAVMFGMFFFLTQFLQEVRDLSPLVTGLAFLPLAAGQFIAARAAGAAVSRFGAKPIAVTGTALITLGIVWLSRITESSEYVTGLLGPVLLFGFGIGLCFMPLNMTILARLPGADTGSAAGLMQTAQQVGVSAGLAILTTVVGQSEAGGLADAIGTGFGAAIWFVVAALAVTLLVIRPMRREVPSEAMSEA